MRFEEQNLEQEGDPMSIIFEHSGSLKNTENFLKRMNDCNVYGTLDNLARQGVEALSSATPVRTGATARSWGYEIHRTPRETTIAWTNDDTNAGTKIAIILQYGHGTGTGGYVYGRDYINPAMKPIFDMIADKVWKEVCKQ